MLMLPNLSKKPLRSQETRKLRVRENTLGCHFLYSHHIFALDSLSLHSLRWLCCQCHQLDIQSIPLASFLPFNTITEHLLSILLLSSITFTINVMSLFYSIPLFIVWLVQDPSSRSLSQILSNPRYVDLGNADSERSASAVIKRKIQRQFTKKGKKYMTKLPDTLYIHTCFQTRGNSKHVEVDVDSKAFQLLSTVKKDSYNMMSGLFSVLYEFVKKQIKKPPRNLTLEFILNNGLFVLIYSTLTFIGLYQIILVWWFPKHAQQLIDASLPPVWLTKRHKEKPHYQQTQCTVLSMAVPFKGFQSFLFNMDGLTFVVNNAANMHICRDRSLFVGDIFDSHISLDTATGLMDHYFKLGT